MELLLFTVSSSTSCDGEQSQLDPFCLLPYSKGWRSDKCPRYPQEIVLELDSDASLSEIVAHPAADHPASFAPSKIELHVGTPLSPRLQIGGSQSSTSSRRGVGGGGGGAALAPPGYTQVKWERVGELERTGAKAQSVFRLRQYTVPHNGWVKLVVFGPAGGNADISGENPFRRVALSQVEIWGEVFRDTRKLLRRERAAQRATLQGNLQAAVGEVGGSRRDAGGNTIANTNLMRSGHYLSLSPQQRRIGRGLAEVVPDPVQKRAEVLPSGAQQQQVVLDERLFRTDAYYRPKQPILEQTFMELGLPLEAVPVTARRPNTKQLDGYSNALAAELVQMQHDAFANHRPGLAQQLQHRLDEVVLLGQQILRLEEDRNAFTAVDCLGKAQRKEEHARVLKRRVLEIGAACDTSWWEQQMALARPAEDEFFRVDFEARIQQLQALLEEEKTSRHRVNTLLDDAECKLGKLRKEHEELEDMDEAKDLQIRRLEEALIKAKEERDVILLKESVEVDRQRIIARGAPGGAAGAGGALVDISGRGGRRKLEFEDEPDSGEDANSARVRRAHDYGRGQNLGVVGGEAPASAGSHDDLQLSLSERDPGCFLSEATPRDPGAVVEAARRASTTGRSQLGLAGKPEQVAEEPLPGYSSGTPPRPSDEEKQADGVLSPTVGEQTSSSAKHDDPEGLLHRLETLSVEQILSQELLERPEFAADTTFWFAGKDPLYESSDEDHRGEMGAEAVAARRLARLREWVKPSDPLYRPHFPALTVRELARQRQNDAAERRLHRMDKFKRAVRKAVRLSDVLKKFSHREVLENLSAAQVLEAGVYDLRTRVAENLLPPRDTSETSSSSGFGTARSGKDTEDTSGTSRPPTQRDKSDHSARRGEKRKKRRASRDEGGEDDPEETQREKKKKKKRRHASTSGADDAAETGDAATGREQESGDGSPDGAASGGRGGGSKQSPGTTDKKKKKKKKQSSEEWLRRAWLEDDKIFESDRDSQNQESSGGGQRQRADAQSEEAELTPEALGRKRIRAVERMLDESDPLYRDGDRDLSILELLAQRKKRKKEQSGRVAVPGIANFPQHGAGATVSRQRTSGVPLSDGERSQLVSSLRRTSTVEIADPVSGQTIVVLTDPETGDVILRDGKPIALDPSLMSGHNAVFDENGDPAIALSDGTIVSAHEFLGKGTLERVSKEVAVQATRELNEMAAQTGDDDGRTAAADAEVQRILEDDSAGGNIDPHPEGAASGAQRDVSKYLRTWMDEFFWAEKNQNEKYQELGDDNLKPGVDFPISWGSVDFVTPRASRAVVDAQPVLGDVFCAAFMNAKDWRLQDFAVSALVANLDYLVARLVAEGSGAYAPLTGGSASAEAGGGDEVRTNDTRFVRDLNSMRSKRHLVAPSSPQLTRRGAGRSGGQSVDYKRDSLSSQEGGDSAHASWLPPRDAAWSPTTSHTAGELPGVAEQEHERKPITLSRIFRVLCDLALAAVDTENPKRRKVPLQIAAVQLLEKATTARFVDDIPVRVALACLKRPCAALINHLLGDTNNRLHHVTESCLAAVITQLGPTPVVSALTGVTPDATALSPSKKRLLKVTTPRLVHLPWRALEARLELAHTLVSICGPPSLNPQRSYSVPTLMPLVITGLNHQMWDVRHLAIEVCVVLFQNVGLKLIPFLKEVPPNLTESLNVRFSEVDAGEYEDETVFANALTQAREEVVVAAASSSKNSPRPRSASRRGTSRSRGATTGGGGAAGAATGGFLYDSTNASSMALAGGAGAGAGSTSPPGRGSGTAFGFPQGSKTVASLEKRSTRRDKAKARGGSESVSPRGKAWKSRSPSNSPQPGSASPRRLSDPHQQLQLLEGAGENIEEAAPRDYVSKARSPIKDQRPQAEGLGEASRNKGSFVERPPSHSYEDYQLQYENRISRALGKDNASRNTFT